LGIDNTFGNDAFENSLSTMDSSRLIVAKNQYNGAKTAKNNFDQIVNQLDKNSEHTAIDAALNNGKDALATVKNLLFAVSSMLDNTAPAINLPQTSLDNLKNSVLTVRTNITAQYSGLVAQEHALTTARNNYYSLQAAVDKTQAAYNDAKNPPRAVDLAATKASLALAQATFNKTILRSPIDGVVSKQDAKVGMIVGAGTQITSIINDKLYQVEAYIPQSDLAKVAVGNPVKITLDNNPGVNFEATLIKINPAGENLSNGIIAYKITVQFNQEDARIKSGLTANIKVTTATKNNILSIPARDVVQKNGNYYVQLKNKNHQLIEQMIQIGIKSSDDRYEIISGLNESDQVVSYSQK
jgi:RND family efflux transporter MFP subunit